MFRFLVLAAVLSLGSAVAVYGQNSEEPNSSQQSQSTDTENKPSATSGESSSKSSQIDISPPAGDEKDHPDSASAVREGEEEAAPNVEEFHSWDPHKAAKDVEVGDYYFRQGNYKAALSRYQEALEYKQNDAVANFRTAQCQEKLNNPQDAVEHYEAYLKILPNGPFSKDARKALAKLQGNSAAQSKSQ